MSGMEILDLPATESVLTTPQQRADALAYLARHDATDCAEALGLAAYTGHARTFRNGSTHAVERGPR